MEFSLGVFIPSHVLSNFVVGLTKGKNEETEWSIFRNCRAAELK